MTRAELEDRRLRAIPDLDSDMMQAKIARKFGVSRTTVWRWKMARANGSTLQRRRTPGRPPRLIDAHMIEHLKDLYRHGPMREFRSKRKAPDGWTTQNFANLIAGVTGIRFSADHTGRLIRAWGLRQKQRRRKL